MCASAPSPVESLIPSVEFDENAACFYTLMDLFSLLKKKTDHSVNYKDTPDGCVTHQMS